MVNKRASFPSLCSWSKRFFKMHTILWHPCIIVDMFHDNMVYRTQTGLHFSPCFCCHRREAFWVVKDWPNGPTFGPECLPQTCNCQPGVLLLLNVCKFAPVIRNIIASQFLSYCALGPHWCELWKYEVDPWCSTWSPSPFIFGLLGPDMLESWPFRPYKHLRNRRNVVSWSVICGNVSCFRTALVCLVILSSEPYTGFAFINDVVHCSNFCPAAHLPRLVSIFRKTGFHLSWCITGLHCTVRNMSIYLSS